MFSIHGQQLFNLQSQLFSKQGPADIIVGHNTSRVVFLFFFPSKITLGTRAYQGQVLTPLTTKQIQEQTNIQPRKSHFSLGK